MEFGRFYRWGISLWANRSAATSIEYGLIVALVVMAAMVAFPSMAGWVNQVISATAEEIPS